MSDIDPMMTNELRRDIFIGDLITLWTLSPEVPFGKRIWTSVTKSMVFVGNYKDWTGADKKQEVLTIIGLLLEKTDSPGPDFIVDRFIEWAAEYGIDFLYDAFKGAFAFDGDPPPEA